MTTNDLALLMLTQQGEATDDTGRVSLVEGFINDALSEIALAINFNSFHTRTTFSTVIGQDQYTLPAGGRDILQLRYTDTGQPIHHWTVQDAARRGVRLENAGRACEWIEDGNVVDGSGNVLYQFRLTPVPDSVLAIEADYYFDPTDVADASTLPVPGEFLAAVRDRVRAYLLERDQKYTAAALAEKRFETKLELLVLRERRKVAAETRVKSSLVRRGKRPEALFDSSHYRNF